MTTKHKYPRSLVEVWDWKAESGKELRGSSDIRHYLEEKTGPAVKRLGLKTASSKHK